MVGLIFGWRGVFSPWTMTDGRSLAGRVVLPKVTEVQKLVLTLSFKVVMALPIP